MKKILLFFIVIVGIFLSTYKLTVSPPTWKDEGIIIQVAQNVARHGVYGIQVAPNNFVSAGFVTTGNTVILPVAVSFKIFGEGLLQARLVMVVYLLLIFLLSYLLIRSEDEEYVTWALLLIVSFAPLYGSGKSVLGEIPGVVFLLAFILVLQMIGSGRSGSWFVYFAAGIMAGLSMATKPIFLIIIPPACLLGYVIGRPKFLSKNIIASFLGALLMVVLWLSLQFSNDSLVDIMNIYSGNLNSVPLYKIVAGNIYNIFTTFQPLYFLGLVMVWAGSVFSRRRRGEFVSYSETVAFSFALISLLAYLKTVGYFRYFLPAQIISLIYLPGNVFYLSRRFDLMYLGRILLIVLILFQFYKTFFDSWVSDYYDITQTTDLGEMVGGISGDSAIFFCNVPEAIPFFRGDNYFQYVEFADNIKRGSQASNMLWETVVASDRCRVINDNIIDYDVVASAGKYKVYQRLR